MTFGIMYNLEAQFGTAEECTNCLSTKPTGSGASAVGLQTKATGDYSFAGGKYSTAPGPYSFSFGLSDTASNEASVALGYQSAATGIAAFATGYASKAYGGYSTAIGVEAHAIGYRSMSIGSYTIANATDAFAFGAQIKATNSSSFVIGTGAGLNYLENNIENTLKIGFGSTKHTLFVSTATATDKTGKIGIGDVSWPEEKLHIKSDIDEDASIYLQASNTNRYGKIYFSDKNHIISAKPNGNIKFETETGQGFEFSNGNVGIGTSNPTDTLDVDGTIRVRDNARFDGNVGIGTTIHNTTFHIETDQPSMQLRSLTQNDYNGLFINHSVGGGQFEWFVGTPEGDAGKFMIASQVTDTHQETTADIANAGFVIELIEGATDDKWKVGIGTSDFQEGYILTIAGKVIAEEVRIEHPDQWYDFVFDEGYDLPKLTDLDSYIKQNKHLPDVPTAKEVAENGYELGKMNGILLKKVEELTLYVIEQQKMMEQQRQAIRDQQGDIEELKEKIDSLQ
ncbi:MAG: hypothetical protein DRJ05_15005 [Bacteroidetes bacterium]|nr:MAG: hypothetical protein DRJ05_15005 [Bacteroidota bacterium]